MAVIFFVVMFFMGLYGIYWASGREFNRRNTAGIEEFASYNQSLIWGAIEGFVRILSILAIGLGFSCGLIMWALHGFF